MSYVNEYIQTFAGEAALSLLRCMAVANGNNSLDSITLTQSEATRYIVTYQENPAIETYHSWKELREEIYTTIHNYRTDTISLRRYICRMLMDVRLPAAYYHCSERADQNSQEINAFFTCIMNCLQKAHSMLEAVGYMKIPLGDYNRKWDKKSFHDIRTISLALERLGIPDLTGYLLSYHMQYPSGCCPYLKNFSYICGVIQFQPSDITYCESVFRKS